MKYSVIVPVYNDPALRDCLGALSKLDFPSHDYEVLIIENGTKTDWIEPLVERYHWTYHFVAEAGSYRARNYGMQLARGEMFAFLDSDCIAAPDWLTQIQKILIDKNIDGVLGLARGDHGNAVAKYEQQMYEANIAAFSHEAKLRRIDTRNVAFKRRVYEHVGEFALVRYGGDMEYGARAHAAGCRIVFAKQVSVTHQHINSLRVLLKKRFQQNSGNMLLLSLHDTTFIQTYFPHLLRYQSGIASWLYWVVFSVAYWPLYPVSDRLIQILPPGLGYLFFKGMNVLAIRLGQLSAIVHKSAK